MEENTSFRNLFNKSSLLKIISLFFVLVSVWWFSIYFRGLRDSLENNYYTLIYPLLSLVGACFGFRYAKHWGGLKSYLGKVLTFFSLGLLFQFIGQAFYAYYIYIAKITVPYPSLGDIGYFGSVVFYIVASYYLAKVAGLKSSTKTLSAKLIAFLIPLGMLFVSYLLFLKEYQFDWTNPVKVFLDFGYPLGQAVYVSIAIMAFILSGLNLGGVMKKPILFLVVALMVQYSCDSMFLYQSNTQTWYVGGVNDYLYTVSYFLMTLSLVYIGKMFAVISESKV